MRASVSPRGGIAEKERERSGRGIYSTGGRDERRRLRRRGGRRENDDEGCKKGLSREMDVPPSFRSLSLSLSPRSSTLARLPSNPAPRATSFFPISHPFACNARARAPALSYSSQLGSVHYKNSHTHVRTYGRTGPNTRTCAHVWVPYTRVYIKY